MPMPHEMTLVGCHPVEAGSLPEDREAVLVFSTGSVNLETPESGVPYFPPKDFSAWDVSADQPEPVALEVVEAKPMGQSWDGIGVPKEVRQWHPLLLKRESIRVYRLAAKSGWKSGIAYRIDFSNADVSGIEDPFEDEPVWTPQSLHFIAGAPVGPLGMPALTLDVEFEAEYATCISHCWDAGDCYNCKGLAKAVQLFHLTTYGLAVDDKTGPLVVRFETSGSDFQSPTMLNHGSFILLPGASMPHDIWHYRVGPTEGDYVGDGCHVCMMLAIEAPSGELLVAPAPHCFEAYKIPKPPEPCDPDDWDYEDGDQPPTLLHWPACAAQTTDDDGFTDVRTGPDGQRIPDFSDASEGGDPDADKAPTTGSPGTSGCSSALRARAGSSWLPPTLLLLLHLVVQALLARRRRVLVPATGATGRFRKRG